MKKILYYSEILVLLLSSGAYFTIKLVDSLNVKFASLLPYFFIIAGVALCALIITFGLSCYAKEIGSDIKHKRQHVKEISRKKVIYDNVTKTELGISLQPEKVLEDDSRPEKIVEENSVAESVISVEKPTVVDEVKVVEHVEVPEEEAPVEEVKEEVVEELPQEENTPVEEVKEELPQEEVKEETTPIIESNECEEKQEEPVIEEVKEEAPVEEIKEEVVEEVKQEELPQEVKEEKDEFKLVVPPVIVEEKVEQVEDKPIEEPVVEEKPVGPRIKLQPTVLSPFKIFDDYSYSIGKHWTELFQGELDKTYFKDMVNFLKEAYQKKNVYPPKEDLMKCFEYCDFDNTRVVIIGKFPFYRKNQADGLAFSTRVGTSPNQTTSIIIKEAISDVGIPVVNTGSLVNWARNGVLLLNSIMTAPSDKPASHSDCGWVTFTNKVIELLNMDATPKVFVLWGEYAQGLKHLITNPSHLILEAPNPSPLSAANGFYGSKPFSKINEFLEKNNIDPIDWTL